MVFTAGPPLYVGRIYTAGPTFMAGVIHPGPQLYGWGHTSGAPGLRPAGLLNWGPRFMAGGLTSGAQGLWLGLRPRVTRYSHIRGLRFTAGVMYPGPQVYNWGTHIQGPRFTAGGLFTASRSGGV